MKNYARKVRQEPSRGVFQVGKEALRLPRRSENELSFTDVDSEGVKFVHHDPLVILAMIWNHLVHLFLIDNGGSVDILYLDVLQKM